MIEIESESDTFSDDEDVITVSKSAKQIALELDTQLDEENSRLRNRKRVYWGLESVFDNYKAALDSIKNKWIKKKSYKTKTGFKEYYLCNIIEKCPAMIQLHILNDSQHVNILRDQEEHKHDVIANANKRLRKEIKEKIFELRITQPLNIIYSLRRHGYTNVPTQRQITNLISRMKKKL
ncbi:unnamed protein product [Brachionus calyciflorus]|uniref:Uncharacterized protein n=1 Tax=Brachionus calyciflorus TaxID=104777 RepID=A0A814N4D0_9BILA|nr:unnamed protein product [Brachionus calyciflorus]